jgi:hypothetical protein
MTGTITLSDGGQNYIEFVVACDVIEEVRPSGLRGWRNTKILNKAYTVGGRLLIDLQWKDYQFPLPYPIVDIRHEETYGSEWLRANMSEEKKLYVCPRGGEDRMMYVVDIDGVPFYFGSVNEAAVAASDSIRNFDKIPAVLLEDIDSVTLFDEIKPGEPNVIADTGEGVMVIYNNYIIDYGIIAHEASHAWAYDKWGQYDPPHDTAYTEVIRFSGEEPITEYAKTNYAEDLAEGVRYYVYSPAFMVAQCPLRYDIIERMMTDPDYYG